MTEIAKDRLNNLVSRIERLEEERQCLSGDIRDIYVEAKSAGFNVKVLRQLIRLRRLDPADAEEQEMLLETYKHAVGLGDGVKSAGNIAVATAQTPSQAIN